MIASQEQVSADTHFVPTTLTTLSLPKGQFKP